MNREPAEDRFPVGVLGLGDLGKRLVAQLLCSDREVLAFDPALSELKVSTLNQAVDPALNTERPDTELFRLASMIEILNTCKIVHWAVPSAKLADLPVVPQDCTVILHDSVMANSTAAIKQRGDKHRFVLAHCLMNDARRVLIATRFGNHEAATEHFEKIGLSPKQITAKEHDTLMAHTQGVFALLIQLGAREKLDAGFAAGNLTPSAIELRSAVINREAHWTAQTLQSILGNPELEPFVNGMLGLVVKKV